MGLPKLIHFGNVYEKEQQYFYVLLLKTKDYSLGDLLRDNDDQL